MGLTTVNPEKEDKVWGPSRTGYFLIIMTIIAIFLFHQVSVYREWVPKLIWSAETLRLNVIANRQAWRACKLFRYCDLRHPLAEWEVVWRGEVAFQV